MIVIKLEGVEYNLPENWLEVSVGKFEKIVEITGRYADYTSEIEYVIDMFTVLTGAPKEVLMRMTRKSFDDISTMLEWIKEEVVGEVKEVFTINGLEYVPVKNLDTLSMGDTVSLEIMIKESNESNILSNILPMLIRRSKKIDAGDGMTKLVAGDFDAENYKETRDLFKDNLMVADVIRLKSFF